MAQSHGQRQLHRHRTTRHAEPYLPGKPGDCGINSPTFRCYFERAARGNNRERERLHFVEDVMARHATAAKRVVHRRRRGCPRPACGSRSDALRSRCGVTAITGRSYEAPDAAAPPAGPRRAETHARRAVLLNGATPLVTRVVARGSGMPSIGMPEPRAIGREPLAIVVDQGRHDRGAVRKRRNARQMADAVLQHGDARRWPAQVAQPGRGAARLVRLGAKEHPVNRCGRRGIGQGTQRKLVDARRCFERKASDRLPQAGDDVRTDRPRTGSPRRRRRCRPIR